MKTSVIYANFLFFIHRQKKNKFFYFVDFPTKVHFSPTYPFDNNELDLDTKTEPRYWTFPTLILNLPGILYIVLYRRGYLTNTSAV
jgi:hypothetical protein